MLTVKIEEHYCNETDHTFIMKATYEGEDLVAEQVIGFYWGEPDADATAEYANSLTAEY